MLGNCEARTLTIRWKTCRKKLSEFPDIVQALVRPSISMHINKCGQSKSVCHQNPSKLESFEPHAWYILDMYQIIYRSFDLSHMKGRFWHISYDHLRSQQGVIHGQRPPTSAVADHTPLQWGTLFSMLIHWYAIFIFSWYTESAIENLYPQGTSRVGREASWVRFSEKVAWFGFCCKQPMHVSSRQTIETKDEMNYVVVFIVDSNESPFSKGGWKRHPSKSIETASSISPKPPNRSKQNGGTRKATKNWKNYWTRHLAQQTDCLLL